MKVVLIEDEKLAAERLQELIGKIDPGIEVIAHLSSVEEGVEWFLNNPLPDLAFLDIQLSDGTSFEIVKQVPITCPVIFTTAYDQYALDAFKLFSLDYLLKPVKLAHLTEALKKYDRLAGAGGGGGQQEKLDQLLEALESKSGSYKSRFLVKLGQHMETFSTRDVPYFYSEDKVVFLAAPDKRIYPVNYSLDQLEEQLDPRLFFRINRKLIVNVKSIQRIHPYFKGRLKLELDPPFEDDVIVSGKRAGGFRKWLDQ